MKYMKYNEIHINLFTF